MKISDYKNYLQSNPWHCVCFNLRWLNCSPSLTQVSKPWIGKIGLGKTQNQYNFDIFTLLSSSSSSSHQHYHHHQVRRFEIVLLARKMVHSVKQRFSLIFAPPPLKRRNLQKQDQIGNTWIPNDLQQNNPRIHFYHKDFHINLLVVNMILINV